MNPSPASAIAVPPLRAERWLLAGGIVLALVVSFLVAKDRLTWFLEVVWAMVGLGLIARHWARFPLTRLLCWLLVLHALVLIHGGAYTYAKTPLGFWLRDLFGFALPSLPAMATAVALGLLGGASLLPFKASTRVQRWLGATSG